MTREMGKPLTETRGDVQEGIDTAYYAATEGRRLFGHTVPSELREQVGDELPPADRRVRASSRRSTFRWRSRRGRCSRRWSAETRASSSRPRTCRTPDTCSSRSCSRPGCRPRSSSSCTASARRSARRSWSIPRFRSISFTGSTETGRLVGETCGGMHKRLSLEMGGKNAQIVLDDADLDLALDGVLWGAFGTTGQRCTATSRLILQDGIHDEFLEPARRPGAGADARRRPEEGDRRRPAHQRERARRRSSATSTSGRRRARICCAAARAPTGEGLEHGFFFEPTIFARVEPGIAARAGGDLRAGAVV